MRAYEILLEYNRALTMRQFGPKILQTIKTVGHGDYHRINDVNLGYKNSDGTFNDDEILRAVFNTIEKSDPTYRENSTTGGIYAPWIAREYGRGNIKRLEDMPERVRGMLVDYHQLKNKTNFNPLFKDIMRTEFISLERYILDFQEEIEMSDRGNFKVYYEDDTVLVVNPLDLQASKYWARYGGHEANWCTRYPDRFAYYTKYGPLYTIIPKQPKYAEEKYQLQFNYDEYKDEEDEPISMYELLSKRFPTLGQKFKLDIDKVKTSIFFVPDSVINSILDLIVPELVQVADETVWEWEASDDYFMKYQFEEAVKREYLVQNENTEDILNGELEPEYDDIDWDEVHSDEDLQYYNYNDNVRRYVENVEDIKNMGSRLVRQTAQDYIESIEEENVLLSIIQIEEVLEYYMENDGDFKDSNYEKVIKSLNEDIDVNLNRISHSQNKNVTLLGKVPIDDNNIVYVSKFGPLPVKKVTEVRKRKKRSKYHYGPMGYFGFSGDGGEGGE